MKILQVLRLALILSAMGTILMAQGLPRMHSVDPTQGKAGDELTISGENLDKKSVSEIFLTDGKSDIKLLVVQQSATSIKFKIPAEAKPGRYSMMLMTAEAEPKLLEQPVRVNVQ